MKNLLQKIALPGMMGLAGLVSGCTVTSDQERTTNNTFQGCEDGADTFTVVVKKERNSYFMGLLHIDSKSQGFIKYTFWCDPKVELSDGEIELKYVLKEKGEGVTYSDIGLSDGRGARWNIIGLQ